MGLAQQVVANDDHGQAAGANIFLRTGVKQAEARDIQRARQDVGRHIRHQGPVAHLWNPAELHAADGLVGRVMHVGGIVRQLPLVLAGDGEVIVGLGRGGNIDVAVAGRLLNSLARPDASVDVVGAAVLTEQVQRNLGELLAGAALQEQHLVVRGDAQQVAQVLLGLLGDADELVAAVAHFHDRQTLAVPVRQLVPGCLQYCFRQGCRSRTEIEQSLAHLNLYS